MVLYVGDEDSRTKLGDISTKGINQIMRGVHIRRPAAERVWEKVMGGMDVKKMDESESER